MNESALVCWPERVNYQLAERCDVVGERRGRTTTLRLLTSAAARLLVLEAQAALER